MTGLKNHPYIPNSVPEIQEEMLKEIGLNSLEELHADVPESLRFKGEMNIDEPILSEQELKKHVQKIMSKNKTCDENLNFLGAGCWQHYVPSVCDEINQRGEFLTAYGGEPYNDEGRFQSLFEYESLMAELVDMDVVNVPTMDWGQAAATAIRMATRITQKKTVLVPKTIGPDRYLIIKNYCKPDINFVELDYNPETGQMCLDALKNNLSEEIACVYFENPTFLGFMEEHGQEISDLAHQAGALVVVGVDPSSLGVIESPSQYGADIICGDLQPLGMHMLYGGGLSGFIATRDEEKYVMEYPSRLFGIAPTSQPGEYGFGDVAYDRTSFGHHREHGKEYVGTQTALWGITAGVYLSLMGPAGMAELGRNIIQKSLYAIDEINKIDGVKAGPFKAFHFKEFVVDFNQTGKTVEEINEILLSANIFGGKDLSKDFENLGQCGLFCVTEIHSKEDIDVLVENLKLAVTGGKAGNAQERRACQ